MIQPTSLPFSGISAQSAALESPRFTKHKKLPEYVSSMGACLAAGLKEPSPLSNVGDVRGKNLLREIEQVMAGGMDVNGVLMDRANCSFPELNHTIDIAPAHAATKEDIDTILAIPRKAIIKIFQ